MKKTPVLVVMLALVVAVGGCHEKQPEQKAPAPELTREQAFPGIHESFPDSARVDSVGRWVMRDFLGVDGLNDVYTMDYIIDGDSLTLFAAEDEGGVNLVRLMRAAGQTEAGVAELAGFGYDENYGVSFAHDSAGQVLAGLKSGWLLGAVGYNERRHRDFVRGWVEGWQRPIREQPGHPE